MSVSTTTHGADGTGHEGLTDAQIDLVQDSFNALVPRGDEFVARFYENLFTQYPATQLLFENQRLEMTQRQVLAALTLAIQGLKRPETLAPMMRTVGERHLGYGVMPSYLPMFQHAVIATIKDFAGAGWSDEVERCWAVALQTVIGFMREGMVNAHGASGQADRLSPSVRDVPEEDKPNVLIGALTAFVQAPPKVIVPAAIVLAVALFFGAQQSTLVGQLVGSASAIAFIIGLFTWVRELPERRKQAVFNAFQTIDAARGSRTSPARVSALESLASGKVSLRGMDLSGVSLLGADLPGINLSGAQLAGTDLREVDLSGANLLDADLTGAQLTHANLSNARLSFANLSGANLSLANLEGADLTCANLTDANLAGAHLKGAKLAGTELQKTNLAGANLLIADITGVELKDVDLRGTTMPDGTVNAE